MIINPEFIHYEVNLTLGMFRFSVNFKASLQKEMNTLVEEFLRQMYKIKEELGEKHRKEIIRFWKLRRKGSSETRWLRISQVRMTQVTPHPEEVVVSDLT